MTTASKVEQKQQQSNAQPNNQQKPLVITEPKKIKPQIVQIEGWILLKIIGHCNEYLPQQQAVSGQLLGLQIGSSVEITNCFATPNTVKIAFSNNIISTLVSLQTPANAQKYQKDMLELLQKIRADNNSVGWYRSALNGAFLTSQTISGQFKHQSQQSSAVCIIYDPTATKNGRLVIRAFRLSDKFMEFYEQKDTGPKSMARNGLKYTDIFEELDVKIHNSHLVHAFLYDLREEESLRSVCFDRLHHLHENALISDLRQLSGSIDQYSKESNDFRVYWTKSHQSTRNRETHQRRLEAVNRERRMRGEKPKPIPNFDKEYPPIPEPDRMESVTICAQMNEYTEDIEASAISALTKLWITQGLHVNKLLADQ